MFLWKKCFCLFPSNNLMYKTSFPIILSWQILTLILISQNLLGLGDLCLFIQITFCPLNFAIFQHSYASFILVKFS